jgi:hypothetical protein
MIIGIALVVDELHKGQRLVYRYPESVPSSVVNAQEQLLKFQTDQGGTPPGAVARLGESHWVEGRASQTALPEGVETIRASATTVTCRPRRTTLATPNGMS